MDGCKGAETVGSSISECECSGWKTGLLSVLETFAKEVLLMLGHGSAPGDHRDISQMGGVRLSPEPFSKMQLK